LAQIALDFQTTEKGIEGKHHVHPVPVSRMPMSSIKGDTEQFQVEQVVPGAADCLVQAVS
jgi:siderophore synthetase component